MDSNILKKNNNRLMLSRKIENSLYYENYIYRPVLKYTKMAGPI